MLFQFQQIYLLYTYVLVFSAHTEKKLQTHS